jgi:hypothetical protein
VWCSGLVALLTVVCVVLSLCRYRVGDYSPGQPFVWIVMLNGSSQWYALYCLYLFYHVTKRRLAPIQSLVKFIGIKVVMFFSWWQGLLISAMVNYGFIRRNRQFGAEDVGVQFEGLLVLMEMLLAACFFLYCFPVSDFSGTRGTPMDIVENAASSVVLASAGGEALPEQTSVLFLGIIPIRVNGNLARNCHWFYKCIMCVPSYVRNFDADGDKVAAEPSETLQQQQLNCQASSRGRRKSVVNSPESGPTGGEYVVDEGRDGDIELAEGVVAAYLRDLNGDEGRQQDNGSIVRSLSSSSLCRSASGDVDITVARSRSGSRGARTYSYLSGPAAVTDVEANAGDRSRAVSSPTAAKDAHSRRGGASSSFYDLVHSLLVLIDGGGASSQPASPNPRRKPQVRDDLVRGLETSTDSDPDPNPDLLSADLYQEDLRCAETQYGGRRGGVGQSQEDSPTKRYVYAKASPMPRPAPLIISHDYEAPECRQEQSAAEICGSTRCDVEGSSSEKNSPISEADPHAGSAVTAVAPQPGEATSVWNAIYLSTVPLELGKDIKDLGKKVIKKAAASPTASYFRRHQRQSMPAPLSPGGGSALGADQALS